MQAKGEKASTQWLIPRVNRPRGVDLVKALREGVLTPADYIETIGGCRTCDDPAVCARLSEGEAGRETLSEPAAAGCRNAALVRELRAF